MRELSDRHSGTLNGRLVIPPVGRSVSVAVRLEADTAADIAVQHTAWMLVSLLVRLVGVVDEVRVGGANALLHRRVIPFATQAGDLRASLVEAASLISGAPVLVGHALSSSTILTVGPGEASGALRVYGEGFTGAISRQAIQSVSDSPLPFGPYIAACLAAGEVFREIRFPAELWIPTTSVSFSAWDYAIAPGSLSAAGSAFQQVELDIGLAGVGAVGSAVMHALWACPGLSGRALVADADPDGIDLTNLNRCVTFHQSHVGRPKASTAAEILDDADVIWTPIDGKYARGLISPMPEVLLSAVDTNRSREDLQQGLWPARLLGASTKDLRAEVLRCGPPGVGPCLRCFNPPEVDLPDDVVRERLRAMADLELAALAREINQPIQLVRRWAREGGCSEVGDAAVTAIRSRNQQPAMFSVGFVSVLAGTLLAAEALKEHLGRVTPLSDAMQSSKFQFWRPSKAGNGRPLPVQRDPLCPACAPAAGGVETWRDRADRWRPGAHDRGAR